MPNLQRGSGSNKLAQDLSTQQQVLNPFVSIQKQVDRALHGFYDLFESRPFNLQDFEKISLAPPMDLIEDANCFKLEIEMAGLDEKDIQLSLTDNLLTIHAEKTVSSKDTQKNYISREINYGCYDRSIVLPQSADGDKASATFKKGMLWINIPKKAGTRNGRQIKIQSA